MAMVKPSRPQFKPEEVLDTAGQYFAQCVRVEQGIANEKYPGGKPLVAIEFILVDDRYPALRGKRTSIVCAESIFRDPQTRRESHFLAHCRMMGAPNPERGVDPEMFVGRHYYVTCEEHDGKAYVRAAVPMPSPAPGQRPAVDPPRDVHLPPTMDEPPPF